MKKTLSLTLACITAISVFASCNTPETKSSITTSAGMDKYVALLEERLTEMPDSLVIATGNDTEKYGVDTSDFIDSEGYTIRASEGDVVILAKTADGIDRAVRQFANYGNSENYTFTYGEGYRIGKLTVNGNDISDYAVVYPDDADECMIYGTDELVRYTSLACGVTLPKYSVSAYAAAAEKPEHKIEFTIDYPALGDEAFTIEVKDNGNINILCGQYRGGLYGVYGLLKDMGWRFLGDGTEYLYEADIVDLTNAINRTEEPAVANRFVSDYPIAYDLSVGARLYYHGRYWNSQTMSKYGYYGVIREACHGLREFAGDIDWGNYHDITSNHQPCYTNENVLQVIEDFYRSYIETKLAEGAVPGKDLAYIDVSQLDTDSSAFCSCSDCMSVIARDGSSSGPVLQMTNRMAAMAAEYSPEINVVMLAYCGTNKPPQKNRTP